MKKILFAVLAMFFSMGATFAQQQQMSPEEKEKKMDEFIQKEIEKLESNLKLEDWQVFYLDSILTHDYEAMRDELKLMQAAKMSTTDAYTRVQDKWEEQIYTAMEKVLDEKQWAKYLKTGAAREKKARDKRAAKR